MELPGQLWCTNSLSFPGRLDNGCAGKAFSGRFSNPQTNGSNGLTLSAYEFER